MEYYTKPEGAQSKGFADRNQGYRLVWSISSVFNYLWIEICVAVYYRLYCALKRGYNLGAATKGTRRLTGQ